MQIWRTIRAYQQIYFSPINIVISPWIYIYLYVTNAFLNACVARQLFQRIFHVVAAVFFVCIFFKSCHSFALRSNSIGWNLSNATRTHTRKYSAPRLCMLDERRSETGSEREKKDEWKKTTTAFFEAQIYAKKKNTKCISFVHWELSLLPQ